MRKYVVLSISLLTSVLVVVFGGSFLINTHNLYLRLIGTWAVKIVNSQGSGGSGFVARGKSGNKYIITNAHVCGLAENNMLYALNGDDKFQVQVKKLYVWNDLCAIEAHRPLPKAIRIASGFLIGEQAWVIGYPLLEPRSVTVGELSGEVLVKIPTKPNPKPEECKDPTYSIEKTGGFMEFFGVTSMCIRELQAYAGTISILPGNSGSATVNMWGSAIGVAFAADNRGTRSYYVPLQDLKNFLEEL